MDNWISVDERMPDLTFNDCSDRVLIITQYGHYEVAYYSSGEWQSETNFLNLKERGYTITHWQQLPKPPKKVIHTQEEINAWDSVE